MQVPEVNVLERVDYCLNFVSLQVQQRNLGVSGRIFTIESTRARGGGRGNVLKLKVNFLPEIITLSKEV